MKSNTVQVDGKSPIDKNKEADFTILKNDKLPSKIRNTNVQKKTSTSEVHSKTEGLSQANTIDRDPQSSTKNREHTEESENKAVVATPRSMIAKDQSAHGIESFDSKNIGNEGEKLINNKLEANSRLNVTKAYSIELENSPPNRDTSSRKQHARAMDNALAVHGDDAAPDSLTCKQSIKANQLSLDSYDSANDSAIIRSNETNGDVPLTFRDKDNKIKTFTDIPIDRDAHDLELRKLVDKKNKCQTELDLTRGDDKFMRGQDDDFLDDSELDEIDDKLLLSKDKESLVIRHRASCLGHDNSLEPSRMSVKAYKSKIASIKELMIKDARSFIMSPPPPGKIVQVTIIREQKCLKSRLYPKYHVYFSVNLLGRQQLLSDVGEEEEF